MTEEEQQAAAAYIKLQENVKDLILSVVYKELSSNPFGMFSMYLKGFVSNTINDDLKTIRVGKAGQTIPY